MVQMIRELHIGPDLLYARIKLWSADSQTVRSIPVIKISCKGLDDVKKFLYGPN